MSKHNDPEWWEQLTELENDLANPSPHHIRLKTKSPSKKGTVNPGEKEMAALAAHEDSYTQYTFTYQAARHESQWLMESLGSFYHHRWIDDVLRMVKGGKEASVYLCQGGSATKRLLAAKVYRPRMFRNLRNDKRYRQGRRVLTTEGKEVKDNDLREMRALNKKTSFGEQLAHTSWLMYEYLTLETLHAAGADVPRPIAVGENAILMAYVGDERMAAPTLNEVRLPRDEARPLFRRILHNVALMLDHGRVHGDLSAYNILYWDGAATLIDFPQVVDSQQNDEAYDILNRDVQRVCDYFKRYGLATDALAITHQLWQQFVTMPDPEDVAADLSRLEGEEEE
jgi:RIO kinase 1